jgi:hypothetical protein
MNDLQQLAQDKGLLGSAVRGALNGHGWSQSGQSTRTLPSGLLIPISREEAEREEETTRQLEERAVRSMARKAARLLRGQGFKVTAPREGWLLQIGHWREGLFAVQIDERNRAVLCKVVPESSLAVFSDLDIHDTTGEELAAWVQRVLVAWQGERA